MSKEQDEKLAISSVLVLAILVSAIVMTVEIYQEAFALAQSNSCGNGFGASHVICQNLGSQIQGRGNSHINALRAEILVTGASH
jgi:hypothetical protein